MKMSMKIRMKIGYNASKLAMKNIPSRVSGTFKMKIIKTGQNGIFHMPFEMKIR